MQVQAWALEDFAALDEKERSELCEGLVFLWLSSLQLWDTQGVWGTDSPVVPVDSRCPQPGHGEVLQEKLLTWELGKLCKRGLVLGGASVSMGYC